MEWCQAAVLKRKRPFKSSKIRKYFKKLVTHSVATCIYRICCSLTSFFDFPFNRRLFDSLSASPSNRGDEVKCRNSLEKSRNRWIVAQSRTHLAVKAWMAGPYRKAVGYKERNSRDESGAINKQRQTHACRSLLDFFSQLFYNSFMFLFWLEPAKSYWNISAIPSFAWPQKFRFHGEGERRNCCGMRSWIRAGDWQRVLLSRQAKQEIEWNTFTFYAG